jgi:hypothetical protein
LICGLLGICFSFVPVIAPRHFLRFRFCVAVYHFKCPAWLAQLPFASFYVGKTKCYGFICIYVLLFSLFGYIQFAQKIAEAHRNFRLIGQRGLLSLYVFSAITNQTVFYRGRIRSSTLIETNRGETVLIDGGGYLSNDTATSTFGLFSIS